MSISKNITRKLRVAMLTFSVLGSFSSMQLVAMKRAAIYYPQGEPELKRQRKGFEVCTQRPTEEDFVIALRSEDVNALRHILERKPEWLRNGPLANLTPQDAKSLTESYIPSYSRRQIS